MVVMAYDFTDQIALVTGGDRGLGRAFAEALAQAGATVAIVARSESQLRDTAQTIEQAVHHRGMVFPIPRASSNSSALNTVDPGHCCIPRARVLSIPCVHRRLLV